MKTDLRAQFRELYTASAREPEFVTVPKLSFLTIDGAGEPSGPEFQDAVGAIYGVAYAMKMSLKQADPPSDYSVMPLEGLWSSEGTDGFAMDRREDWRWTLMILQPDFITRELLRNALHTVAERRGRTPALARLKLTTYHEGRAVQMLHIGPYSAEARTLERMCEFAVASGLRQFGRHHEIYLSDPRRTAPEKLKTLLRLPVKKAAQVRAAGA